MAPLLESDREQTFSARRPLYVHSVKPSCCSTEVGCFERSCEESVENRGATPTVNTPHHLLAENRSDDFISAFVIIIMIILNNFCIALFSGVPELTAIYNILQHFYESFTNIRHIIMTINNV